MLEEAAALAAALDKPRLEAWSLAFLARGQVIREEWDSARTSAARSVEVSRAAGWITFLAFPQSLLATVDLAVGMVDEAVVAFESAFALGCQIGDPCWEGIAARGIGLVHHERGSRGECHHLAGRRPNPVRENSRRIPLDPRLLPRRVVRGCHSGRLATGARMDRRSRDAGRQDRDERDARPGAASSRCDGRCAGGRGGAPVRRSNRQPCRSTACGRARQRRLPDGASFGTRLATHNHRDAAWTGLSDQAPDVPSRSDTASARSSAERAVQAHLVERALKDRELLVVEALEEQLRDPLEMDGDGLREPRQASVRQRDDDPAAVRIGRSCVGRALPRPGGRRAESWRIAS